MPPGCKNYFELKAIKKKQMKEKLPILPIFAKSWISIYKGVPSPLSTGKEKS